MDTMPRMITMFAVTMTPQRMHFKMRSWMMRVRVIAKETLDQAVAMVVKDVEMWCKRKNLRLSSSVS